MSAVDVFLNIGAAPIAKPVVELPSGNVQVRDTALQLAKLIGPKRQLFVRGNSIVELVEDANGPRLEQIREHHAVTRFELFCTFMAWRVGKDGMAVLKPTKIPVQDAKAILVSRELLEGLPRIELVSQSPLITPDGTVLQQGYHDHLGGVLITSPRTPDDVPLADAVVALLELLEDFRFSSPGDHARALASIITPALKMGGILTGPIPIDVAEADQSQSGKTFRQKLVRAIYGEDAYPIARRNGGVGSTDESLSAALQSGKPFIAYDNLRGALDSQLLEMTLTWGKSVAVRVPHQGELLVNPSRVCFQITSNGVETTRDLANRSSIVRIKKQPQGYNFKAYPEGDLLTHVEAHQPFYLGCVFSVINAWIQQGKPRSQDARHAFREWASVVDWIVQHLLYGSPLMDGHEAAQQRVSDPLLTWLRRVAVAVTSNPFEHARELRASDLFAICDNAGITIPGAHSPERAVQTIGVHMAKLFRDQPHDRIQIDGLDVFRVTRKDPTEAYKEIIFYRFTGSHSSTPGT